MTNKEAIERLEAEKRCVVGACDSTCKYWETHECHKAEWQSTQYDAINIAIKALDKIDEYEVDHKKQVAMDVVVKPQGEYVLPKYLCPICTKEQKNTFKNRNKGCYCERCGQKLKWS